MQKQREANMYAVRGELFLFAHARECGWQLLLFVGPEAAKPVTEVVLDGYYVRDSTKDKSWTGPSGEEYPKEAGERLIPTLEVKTSRSLPRRSARAVSGVRS